MAYSLGDRFPLPPRCIKLLDPGAYQNGIGIPLKPNNVAFLSKTSRNTQPGNKIWTHAIYKPDKKPRIPNCTSIKSKRPRFPYESLSKQDLEEILCRCGFQNPCECPLAEVEIPCQGKVHKHLFKGLTPNSSLGVSISVPSKRHRGYEIFPDGSRKQILDKVPDECPPFYDSRVNEANAYYRGWKWSKWKSKRTTKPSAEGPGPAYYILERPHTQIEICAEQLRAYRRKTCKQLRFIEMVQNQNLLEGRPGPADYSPMEAQGTKPQFHGFKAERFPVPKYDSRPGPTTYRLKRTFDLPKIPEYACHAKLLEPAGFGHKAPRFISSRVIGPGPTSYAPKSELCQFVRCPTAPFGSSAARFKEKLNTEDEEDDTFDEIQNETQSKLEFSCPAHTWVFKSKTVRMKPLQKKSNEPSPADLSISRAVVERSPLLQYIAPFNSSEGRFQPWYDWMPVFGKEQTPGPCYYSLEKPKCLPAVHHGPLFRAKRFPAPRSVAPAPNEYKVCGGIENILSTHNNRLKINMKNQHTFHWEPPHLPNKLSYEEQEKLLFEKTMEMLDKQDIGNTVENSTDMSTKTYINYKAPVNDTEGETKKLLRSFLYRKPIPHYY